MRKRPENVTNEERQEAKRRIEGSLAPMTDGEQNIKNYGDAGAILGKS
jgi:hypothetical protein